MWGQMRVLEVGRPELAGNVGRTLEEIAASQGKRPVDAYFDLGLADDLETRFQSSTFNFDPAGIARLIADDRCLIGLSDGGAHVDFICDVGYATALLDLWVRQRGVLSLEKAVHKLTQVPADRSSAFPTAACCRKARSPISSLFDPATVTAKAPKYANDLPCNGRRLVSESEGIKATFVAGTQLYDEGKHTRRDARPDPPQLRVAAGGNHRHPGRRGALDRSAPAAPLLHHGIMKLLALVAVPAAVVTPIFPVLAPAGTVAVIFTAELTRVGRRRRR